MKKKSVIFKGVFPALVTPFDDEGKLDAEGLKNNVHRFMEAGCAGVAWSGSTGEHPLLTADERIEGIHLCREAMGPDGFVIAGAGARSTAETLVLVRDVKEAGADAALVLSPIGGTTDDGMVRHYEILSEVGLPLILYNYPAATGIDISFELFTRLIEIENVVGIKDTSGNLPLLAKIFSCFGTEDISVFTGCDDLILPAYAVGVRAVILAMANVAPKQIVAMEDHLNGGRLAEAREIYWRLANLIDVLCPADNFPAALKKALEILGLSAGAPRLPILPADEETTAEVKKALKEAGLI